MRRVSPSLKMRGGASVRRSEERERDLIGTVEISVIRLDEMVSKKISLVRVAREERRNVTEWSEGKREERNGWRSLG
jgi:hypothetical protein